MKGMLETRLFAWMGLIGSFLCLLAGYGLNGYWAILFVFPAVPVCWILMRKVPIRITISILFFMDILLNGIGLLLRTSPYLMLIGSACALVAWESAQFLLNFQDAPAPRAGRRLEHVHNRDMVLAVGSGVLLSLLGLNIHLQLPFGVIAVLALLAVYGLFRGFSLLHRVS